jgi:hypothetical protein
LLLRWAPATVVRDVLEPAIADLQYEAGHAPTVDERRQIILRGYCAIGRALVFSLPLSIEPDRAIRAALALCALGTAAALLHTTALAAHADGRVLSSAILAPGMLAPFVLRVLGITSSHCRETSSKRAVAAVSLGSGIATAALLIARWPHGQQLSIGLAMTPFYVALFAALFALTLLPFLLVARAFIARPGLLALAGLICSPAPLIAGTYIDHGTLAACLEALRRTPLSFAASSLPFITGAMAVGWRLPPSSRSLNSPLHS